MIIDPRLKDFATERQAEIIDAVLMNKGNITGTARDLNLDQKTIRKAIAAAQKKARAVGIEPHGLPGFTIAGITREYDGEGNIRAEHLREVPESAFETGGIGEGQERDGGGPFLIKGVSTLFGADGEQRAQWVKTRLDTAKVNEMMRVAAEVLAEKLPRVDPTPAPEHTREDLCNQFTLTDSHVGMMSWGKETGARWDLKIAEHVLLECFRRMMLAAPRAKVGIVNQLGDWVHFDSLQAVTPTNGHILDADSRFSKVVAVAIRLLRMMVELALTHHENVILVVAEGNHDMASAVWLRQMFKALYENEPRVQIIDSELPYYVHMHGKTMLCYHHGHLSKNEKLPLLFAAKYPAIWGATTKRYINTGHRHHVDEKEHPGIKLIQHPTLAAPDAYAARGGWISEREATAMTFHREYGLVARNTVTPEMIEEV